MPLLEVFGYLNITIRKYTFNYRFIYKLYFAFEILMDVYSITESFVRNALAVATTCPSAKSFNESWYEEVSKETGLTKEEVRLVHHPFWWYLTSNKGPLEYIQNNKHGGDSRVGFNCSGEIQITGIKELTEAVLKEYREIIEEKFRKHISISRQAA